MNFILLVVQPRTLASSLSLPVHTPHSIQIQVNKCNCQTQMWNVHISVVFSYFEPPGLFQWPHWPPCASPCPCSRGTTQQPGDLCETQARFCHSSSQEPLIPSHLTQSEPQSPHAFPQDPISLARISQTQIPIPTAVPHSALWSHPFQAGPKD